MTSKVRNKIISNSQLTCHLTDLPMIPLVILQYKPTMFLGCEYLLPSSTSGNGKLIELLLTKTLDVGIDPLTISTFHGSCPVNRQFLESSNTFLCDNLGVSRETVLDDITKSNYVESANFTTNPTQLFHALLDVSNRLLESSDSPQCPITIFLTKL